MWLVAAASAAQATAAVMRSGNQWLLRYLYYEGAVVALDGRGSRLSRQKRPVTDDDAACQATDRRAGRVLLTASRQRRRCAHCRQAFRLYGPCHDSAWRREPIGKTDSRDSEKENTASERASERQREISILEIHFGLPQMVGKRIECMQSLRVH